LAARKKMGLGSESVKGAVLKCLAFGLGRVTLTVGSSGLSYFRYLFQSRQMDNADNP
jgi:hypothetical protein